MSENVIKPENFSTMIDKSASAINGPIERTLERFMDMASVDMVYARPVKHGDTIIISAAEVIGGLGFGMGSGVGIGDDDDEEAEKPGNGAVEKKKLAEEAASAQGVHIEARGGAGGGGGGGGRVFARPVAVIISGPDGVRVEPVIDATKIVLAFFTALGFMASMAARMRRGRGSDN